MFVRNLLKAGDFATMVPVGMKATIQYNESGILEKVYTSWDYKNSEEVPQLVPLLLRSSIPSKLTLKGATTFITGCFYSENLKEIKTSEELLDYFIENNEEFHFYAGNIVSHSATFRGAVPIRQWLATSGFSVLPGYVISAELKEEGFKSFLLSNKYPFEYPLITNYMVFRNGECSIIDTNIYQKYVKSINRYVDEQGFVKCKLVFKDKSSAICEYSEVVIYQVHPDCIVTFDTSGNIIHCFNTSSKVNNPYSSDYECPFCGRVRKITTTKPIKCLDDHCVSNMFNFTNQFLKYLGLKQISYNEYTDCIKELGKTGYTPLDMLEYLKIDTLSVNLKTVLRACIPKTVLPNKEQLHQLCQACNYSKSSIIYYCINNDKLFKDLNLDVHLYSRFVNWLNDPYNATFIESAFNHPCINVYEENQYFDGPPILNKKKIYLTGKFKHGTKDEISRILKSYYADVVSDYKNGLDMVVVGDTNDGVNGMSVSYARSRNIPVFSEKDLFTMYNIETDLRELQSNW